MHHAPTYATGTQLVITLTTGIALSAKVRGCYALGIEMETENELAFIPYSAIAFVARPKDIATAKTLPTSIVRN